MEIKNGMWRRKIAKNQREIDGKKKERLDKKVGRWG